MSERDDNPADELASRIARLRDAEEASETLLRERLSERLNDLAMADDREASLMSQRYVELPAVCLDAMVPGQRMEIDTSDPQFGSMLRTLGLGGMFFMTSLRFKERRVRRQGVIVRIAHVDAIRSDDRGLPASVSASLVAKRRACILGSSRQRLGRWRRMYDPDGEVSALGWGEEALVKTVPPMDAEGPLEEAPSAAVEVGSLGDGTRLPLCRLRLMDEEEVNGGGGGGGVAGSGNAKSTVGSDGGAEAACTRVVTLLGAWSAMVRDPATFDDVNVVASARTRHGEPGLRVNASRVLDSVLEDLGPRPLQPTALALWVAAIINPLPALGVAPECRAAVLEAPGAIERLAVVERALLRSLRNLRGELDGKGQLM